MRYGLTPVLTEPERLAKLADVCTLYQDAPQRAAQGERILSTDELSQVQAGSAYCFHFGRPSVIRFSTMLLPALSAR